MIRRTRFYLLSCAVFCAGLALAAPAVPAATAQEGLPADARPLRAFELLVLFGDKTWQWSTGGGYFDTNGRVFRARTADEGGETVATGTWHLTDAGMLCFKAVWQNAEGSFPARTCFWHAEAGGDIYQRSAGGNWYIFRHAEPDPADEFNKLVREDLVGATQPCRDTTAFDRRDTCVAF